MGLFLTGLGLPKVGLQVCRTLVSLSSQSLSWYLALQQPILVVPDAAASSSGLCDHHTARLHIFYMVWHSQESPQCCVPEAEIRPALVSEGELRVRGAGQGCSHQGPQHPQLWTLSIPNFQALFPAPNPSSVLLRHHPFFYTHTKGTYRAHIHTHTVPCPQ